MTKDPIGPVTLLLRQGAPRLAESLGQERTPAGHIIQCGLDRVLDEPRNAWRRPSFDQRPDAIELHLVESNRHLLGRHTVHHTTGLSDRHPSAPGDSCYADRSASGLRCPVVPTWEAIEQAEPEFAERVRRLFDAGRHKTIATLRADGSPRISGIECEFANGSLRFGSMAGARKGADLIRDPRFALHGPTFHPEEGKESDWSGEAKIAGLAIPAGPVTPDDAGDQPDGEMFVADITEVVITGLNAEATKLVVESWTPERGLRRVERT